MEIKPLSGWHNFDTGVIDWHEDMPEDLRPYVADIPAARALFDLYVNKIGKTQVEAFLLVGPKLDTEEE